MPPTYATIAARGMLAASIHNPQSLKTLPAQVQREIIVNIRDPFTIANLRAMNPRNLKAHVDLAIEQSGDLSIKSATTRDMEALRQFADDWVHNLGERLFSSHPDMRSHSTRHTTSSITSNDGKPLISILEDPDIPKCVWDCAERRFQTVLVPSHVYSTKSLGFNILYQGFLQKRLTSV